MKRLESICFYAVMALGFVAALCFNGLGA